MYRHWDDDSSATTFNPLLKIGIASDRLVRAGIVTNRLRNMPDLGLLPDKKEIISERVVTVTRVSISEIGSSCNLRSLTVVCIFSFLSAL